MKYSETGIFTKEQIRLAKNIARNIKKLRATGCFIVGKQYELLAYHSEDIKHMALENEPKSSYTINSLTCGRIDDSGANDDDYFEEGYITEE